MSSGGVLCGQQMGVFFFIALDRGGTGLAG